MKRERNYNRSTGSADEWVLPGEQERVMSIADTKRCFIRGTKQDFCYTFYSRKRGEHFFPYHSAVNTSQERLGFSRAVRNVCPIRAEGSSIGVIKGIAAWLKWDLFCTGATEVWFFLRSDPDL